MGAISSALHRVNPSLHQSLAAMWSGEFELLPPRRIFAEKPIHTALLKLFADAPPGYFIEAGANDGLTRSNTAYLERHHGWRGLLVEPIPHRVVECERNRPRSHVVHAALVAPEKHGAPVELLYMDRMSMVVSETNHLDARQHVSRFRSSRRHRQADEAIVGTTISVPGLTLDSILLRESYPPVDFLSLDVEGLEVEALRGLDLGRNRPRYILIEDWDKQGVSDLLLSRGYHLHSRVQQKDAIYRRLS